MLYICDFFANNKEAVSNQIDLLKKNTPRSYIFAASIFMNQKILSISDLREGKIILPKFLYEWLLPVIVLLFSGDIHYFEEESSTIRRNVLNRSQHRLYISMYRRPTLEYVKNHLLQYRNLNMVFVELESHKKLLIEFGFDQNKIYVSKTPSLVDTQHNIKEYDSNNLSLLYASWNTREDNYMFERGKLYMLDFLVRNNNATLHIPLRDDNITEFISEAKKRHVENRVNLINVHNVDELTSLYKNCDFVMFTPQIKVTKDVPNSLIDGFACGKPCIVSSVIDFHEVINKHGLGVIIDDMNKAPIIDISKESYAEMKKRVNSYYEKNHRPENYLKIREYYNL